MGQSLMTSHSRGQSFNGSPLIISQTEPTIEGFESYSVWSNNFQLPTVKRGEDQLLIYIEVITISLFHKGVTLP